MRKIIFIFIYSLFIVSCNGNEDICVEDGTPKLYIKFRNAAGAEKTVDSLYVNVELANNTRVNIASAQVNLKEIKIPLRVDEVTFTDVYVKTRKNGSESKIRLTYDRKLEYASPACGFRVYYKNLNQQLLQSNPVLQVQSNQYEIINENEPHLYFIF